MFGDREESSIAWLPVMSRAAVRGTVAVDGRAERVTGTGYHDHNWGDVALAEVVDRWYWGRAHLGDYTVVTLHVTTDDGVEPFTLPLAMVARAGEIVAGAAFGDVEVTVGEARVHHDTGVAIPGHLTSRVRAGDDLYSVAFRYDRDVVAFPFGEGRGYHRLRGAVTLEHTADGRPVEQVEGDTTWEVLSFGGRPPAAPAALTGSHVTA